jgi:hypothetical protein
MILCFIDPPSEAYDNERFFDINNPLLNRDNGLLPYYNLKNELEDQGYKVTTFDRHQNFETHELKGALYISFSRKRNYDLLSKLGLRLFAFYLLEPPLIDQKMYELLPILTQYFENAFIHNVTGDCYSLKNVNENKLKKLFWPQPLGIASNSLWENTKRLDKIVLINGHHKPRSFGGRELYSERIKWGTALDEFIEVDLYGRGWMKRYTRSNLWLVYLLNYFKIKKIYKGACNSKIETMTKYKFSLCFENLKMDGYITEKIFDCFFAGTVPIYWGCTDIDKWIPANCYIDIRKFSTPKDLAFYLKSVSNDEIEKYKENAKKFLQSEAAQGYFNIFITLKRFL